MRKALSRLFLLLGVGILVTLALVGINLGYYLNGIYGGAGSSVGTGGVDWFSALSTVGTVLLGLTIAALTIFGLYLALTGFGAWRAGRRLLRAGAVEIGPDQVSAVARSDADARRVFLSLGGWIGVIIFAGICVGITDGILLLAGASALPSSVASAAVAIPAAAVLVMTFHYAGRHLGEAIESISEGASRLRLTQGAGLMVLGAAIGIVGAFSSLFWPLELVTVVSLGVIAYGVTVIRAAYDDRLNSPIAPLQPRTQGPGVSTS